MKLNIEVWDVEISTGKMSHHYHDVFVQFRRSPDIVIVQELLALKSEYGWAVEDLREADSTTKIIQSDADFRIKCVGADSVDVGNEIARHLSEAHGMRCRKVQRLSYKAGYDKLYSVEQFRKVLVAEQSDISLF